MGWGIAYYINDTLVPELVVQRGQTYTFMVEAGNTPANPANYHPLYITDDIHGSRVFKTPEEKKVIVFCYNDQYTVVFFILEFVVFSCRLRLCLLVLMKMTTLLQV